MASMWYDVDSILDVRVPKPEGAPAQFVEDKVLVALFTTTTALLPPQHERAKMHQSREICDARSRKKERTEMEAAKRASLIHQEAR